MECVARQMGQDTTGEFSLKGWNTEAYIPSNLWSHFLKDGATFGIVFGRPVKVTVFHPGLSPEGFSFECSRDLSIFELRLRLFAKFKEIQHWNNYVLPECAEQLEFSKPGYWDSLPNDHRVRDHVIWGTNEVQLCVTGLVHYWETAEWDNWLSNTDATLEANTAYAEDVDEANRDGENPDGDDNESRNRNDDKDDLGETDSHAPKDEDDGVEASIATLPGENRLNEDDLNDFAWADREWLLMQGIDPSETTDDGEKYTPSSANTSPADAEHKCAHCGQASAPTPEATWGLDTYEAIYNQTAGLPTTMDDTWTMPAANDDDDDWTIPTGLPDGAPTAVDDWQNSVLSEVGQPRFRTARKAPCSSYKGSKVPSDPVW